MAKKEPLVVYWAPSFELTSELTTPNWNLMYREPLNVYEELIAEKEPKSGNSSMFNCPAVRDRLKSTFVFKNNLKTTFSWDFTDLENPKVESLEGTLAAYYKHSSLKDKASVCLTMQWVFFCEESVTALMNPPTAHEPTDLQIKGMFPVGRMDISKWFRPVSAEFQMWDSKGLVTVHEDDPIFYLEIMTDRPIVLKRFKMDSELFRLMGACTNAPRYMGSNLPLIKRYSVFLSSKMDRLVLNAIKNNLV